MAALDPAFLAQLQAFVQQISSAGGSLSRTLGDLSNAGQTSATAQTKVAASVQKAGDSSAYELAALNKKLKLAGKSFDQFHDVLSEVIDGTKTAGSLHSSFVKDISSSYQHAKSMLDEQVSKTFTTWSELDKLYPEALKNQIKSIAGASLKIENYADTLKFDDYVIAQQAFIKSFKENNGKMGAAQLNLLANLHTLSKELGDPSYFAGYAKSSEKANEFAAALEKYTSGVTLNAKEIGVVNEYFQGMSNKGVRNALGESEQKLKGFTKGVVGTAKSIKDVGGSFKNVMLKQLEGTFGEAGNTIRNAIAGRLTAGGMSGTMAGLTGTIAVASAKMFWEAGKKAMPLFMEEASEWMKSGTELHDLALIQIGVGQEAYLKVMSQNKALYRSIEGGQESVDKLMKDHTDEFTKLMGGDRKAGLEMAARMATLERNASGGAQGLSEFSKTLSDTAKWADVMNKTTALTAPASLELYESMLLDSNISYKLAGLKNKERIAYLLDLKAFAEHSAQLGYSKEAIKTFAAGFAADTKRTIPSALMSGAGLQAKLQQLSNFLPNNKDLQGDIAARAGSLESKSNKSAAEKQDLSDILDILVNAEAEVRADNTKGGQYNTIVAAIEQALPMSAGSAASVAKKEEELPKTQAYKAGIIKAATNMVGGNTPANREKAIQEKKLADLAKAEEHDKTDLSIQAGKAAIAVKNFTDALDTSQTGIIPSLIIGAFTGAASGIIGGAMPALFSVLGSAIGAGGVAPILASLGTAAGGLGLVFGGLIPIVAGAIAAFSLYKGVEEQQQKRLERVVTGTGGWFETLVTWDSDIEKYKKEKSLKQSSPTLTNEVEDKPISKIVNKEIESHPLSNTLNDLTANVTTLATPPVDVVNQMIDRLDILTTTFNDNISNMVTATNTINNYLRSIDKNTTDWYTDVKVEKAATTPDSLFDIMNKSGGNTVAYIKAG